MATITLEDIRRDVASYLRRVRAGESFVITEQGEPIAEIKPVASRDEAPETTPLRPFGLARGTFVVPDDFDDPLPEDVLLTFEL